MSELCIDLFCGLGGWTEGFLAEGYDVIGFDIERRPYPAQLVLQDVLTLHGSQFKDATCIVASPPCQAYSYRAMPWKRAKALPPPDNTLFDACFRIQREACEAAGRYIPMVVENVCGAQKWVGKAAWHYGSYYLWGDVPALMPMPLTFKGSKVPGFRFDGNGSFQSASVKVSGQDWNNYKKNGEVSPHWTMQAIPDGRKIRRKQASALIAKIPFPLARHIARVFKSEQHAGSNGVLIEEEYEREAHISNRFPAQHAGGCDTL